MLTGPASHYNIHDLSGKPELDKFEEDRFLAGPLLADARSSPPKDLPKGFPDSVFSERTWSPSDFRDRNDFVVQLNGNDIHEIEQALEHFKETYNQNPDEVSRETFPLPTLAPRLERKAHQVHYGSGCLLLRGLNPAHYTAADNLLVYLGVTSHIAQSRAPQDTDGNMLVHIMDYLVGEERRPTFSNQAIPFHVDQSDVVAMYVLSVAAQGGESRIASGAHIYNVIASTQPDVISVLAEACWPFHRFGNPSQWTLRPLLFNFPDHGPVFFFDSRHLIRTAANADSVGAPRLTEEQVKALAVLEQTAQDCAYSVEFQPGDIQLLNNLSVLHARDAFRHGNKDSARHILRLWLENKELAWKKPEVVESARGTAYRNLRDDGSVIKRRWALSAESFTLERISRRFESCN